MKHYSRWQKKGDPLYKLQRDGDQGCSVEGCNKPHYGRGYCQMHHFRFWKFGDPGELDMRRNANGGGTVNSHGYRLVSAPGHPNAQKSGKIYEHVLVMTELLGRALKPGENVHHKNGIRTDNRPANLELWSRSQPAGRRVRDWLTWAVEQYPEEVKALLAGEPISL